MALFGSSFGAEVGLRLLLSPVSPTIISRTACVVVGVGCPVYSTFKALENKDQREQEKWLVYWAVYGCFHVAEMVLDKFLAWFPYYHHAKLVFLIWLQLPISDGARHCFMHYLRPFLLRHQHQLDWMLDGTRNEINKFVLAHQQEIKFIKDSARRVASSVYQSESSQDKLARLSSPHAGAQSDASPLEVGSLDVRSGSSTSGNDNTTEETDSPDR